MRLLLISNSTNAGEPYLQYPMPEISRFLGDKKLNCIFLPYAGVTVSFDEYESKVVSRFEEIGQTIKSIHRSADPVKAIQEADVIVVGGGNTWQLLRMVHDNGITAAVREKVMAGTPYIGWSAGSNLACPTIRTTNDMPIIDPLGFEAFNMVPFQINPHYLDANPDGHAGETREQRIQEFLEINPGISVLGLREGCMLRIEGLSMKLIGPKTMRHFIKGQPASELLAGEELGFLLRS